MDVNREAISFAAFSLAKILAAELLRKGILDQQEFLSAISDEAERQRAIPTATNADTAVLLTVYRDEIDPDVTDDFAERRAVNRSLARSRPRESGGPYRGIYLCCSMVVDLS